MPKKKEVDVKVAPECFFTMKESATMLKELSPVIHQKIMSLMKERGVDPNNVEIEYGSIETLGQLCMRIFITARPKGTAEIHRMEDGTAPS